MRADSVSPFSSSPTRPAYCATDVVKRRQRKKPSLRLIPARWVCARKNPTRVRCRIVAKDTVHGSPRKQGFSSPTPSHDAMMLTLIFMATRDMQGCAADIGHAFMNSPLDTKSNPVVLKLPLSISSEDGQAIFFFLYCALNGLRDASLAWLKLLSSLIRPLGLLSDAREPCLFAGVVWHKDRSSRVMIVCYVDDLLIITDDQWAEDLVLSAIGKRVTEKVTGRVKTSSQGGGMVEFIGRCIRRWPGQSAVEVGVKSGYLQSCFDAFGIQKGTTSVPDLAGLLEKTGAPALTSEAYSRFRRVLGKVLWYAQTRQDLKLMIGLISTQQAAPTQSTEAALRALLRYLYTDRHVALRLPSSELSGEFLECSEEVLRSSVHVFADASHAPYRFICRRGITGGAICFGGGLVRGIAKVQGVVCLSSCEAELHALQHAAQEAIAFLHLLDRVLTAFGELQGSIDVQMSAHAEDEDGEEQRGKIYTELLTDSQAALDVIHAEDVPKRSRHVEVRLAWMREHLLRGRLKLRWLRGAENAADLYTKNLGTRLFQEHRTRLGFITQDGHVEALYMLSQLRVSPESMKESDEVAVLEVFCSEGSALCQVCGSLGVPYCGITANAETSSVDRNHQGHHCLEEQRALDPRSRVYALLFRLDAEELCAKVYRIRPRMGGTDAGCREVSEAWRWTYFRTAKAKHDLEEMGNAECPSSLRSCVSRRCMAMCHRRGESKRSSSVKTSQVHVFTFRLCPEAFRHVWKLQLPDTCLAPSLTTQQKGGIARCWQTDCSRPEKQQTERGNRCGFILRHT